MESRSYGQKLGRDLGDDKVQGGAMYVGGSSTVKVNVIERQKIQK